MAVDPNTAMMRSSKKSEVAYDAATSMKEECPKHSLRVKERCLGEMYRGRGRERGRRREFWRDWNSSRRMGCRLGVAAMRVGVPWRREEEAFRNVVPSLFFLLVENCRTALLHPLCCQDL